MSRRDSLLLAVVLLLGFALRFYRLDYQSAWFDEASSLTIAAEPLPVVALIAAEGSIDSNPPLYHYLLHGLFTSFGYGVFQARFFSLVCGTAAIALLYLLGAALFDSTAGLAAAFLLAISQLGVVYSQEARAYELALLLTVTAAWLFVRALGMRDGIAWFGFVLASTAVAYAHYYAVLGPITLAAFALLFRKRYPIPMAWWMGGAALAFALYLPWLIFGIPGALSFHFKVGAEQLPTVSAHWFSLPSAIGVFNNAKWSIFSRGTKLLIYCLGLLLFTLPTLYAWRAASKDAELHETGMRPRDGVFLLTALTWSPVIAILLLSMRTGVYSLRYLVFCTAPYYALAAYGLLRIPKPPLKVAALALIAILSLASLYPIYFMPWKEDNRDALGYYASHRKPTDAVIFLPPNKWIVDDSHYWTVYHRDDPLPNTTNLRQVLAQPGSYPVVWIVWDRTWWLNLGHVAAACDGGLRDLSATHVLADDRKYFGAETMLYRLKPELQAATSSVRRQ